MRSGIDILENDLIEKYPLILETLLFDHTTQQNIFWATDNYSFIGEVYSFYSQITPELITGDYGSIIMPRVHKDKIVQLSRSKEMAEVFTPSWICNSQNNLIDNAWFGRRNVFNTEKLSKDGSKYWVTTKNKIVFPNEKTWENYICDIRLEIACGEAPYITSRYDTTTAKYIDVENRIGILDRKLRIINENVENPKSWFKAAKIAYENTYAFEWQGDSLLLAREAMLITFIENYVLKFGKEPTLKSINDIANIISWNVWQMDGLKGVVPNSCKSEITESKDLFGDLKNEEKNCKGCNTNEILHHNGLYCHIMDWSRKSRKNGTVGTTKRFVDLLSNKNE